MSFNQKSERIQKEKEKKQNTSYCTNQGSEENNLFKESFQQNVGKLKTCALSPSGALAIEQHPRPQTMIMVIVTNF